MVKLNTKNHPTIVYKIRKLNFNHIDTFIDNDDYLLMSLQSALQIL